MQRVLCPRPSFNTSTVRPLLQRICSPVASPKLALTGADLKLQNRPLASPSITSSSARHVAAPHAAPTPAAPNQLPPPPPDEMVAQPASAVADQSTGSLFWDSQISLKEAFLASLSGPPSDAPWVVVMGNEAGDLDSLASSLAHAYLLNTVEGVRAVPLILTPRAALRLRPENELALRLTRPEAGHETLGSLEDVLLCVDDLPIPTDALLPRGGIQFALVDHNALLAPFRPAGGASDGDRSVEASVIGILDHHADDGAHDAASPRIIDTTAASCASIVASYWATRLPAGGQGLGGQPLLPAEVARLLLSAILIDSNGLKAGGKANDIDWAAVEFLWPLTGMASAREATDAAVASVSAASRAAPPRLKELADELNEVKNDVGHLTLPDLLARDYKAYAIPSAYLQSAPAVQLGLASVPVSLKRILSRAEPATPWPAFVAGLDAYATEHRLTLLGVLTSFKSETKGKRKRELVLYSPAGVDPADAASLWAAFVPRLEASELLSLGPWKAAAANADDGWAVDWAGGHGQVWSQRKADATRKTVAPVLREVLSGGVAQEDDE